MDLIDTEFSEYESDETRPLSVRAAVRLAKGTLNRYYQSTDLSETYRIAMSTFICPSVACGHIRSLSFPFASILPSPFVCPNLLF